MIKSLSKRPNSGKVEIDLTGPQGNAYVLLGIAADIHSQLELDVSSDDVQAEMTSGDYENLINVMEKYYGDYIIMYR